MKRRLLVQIPGVKPVRSEAEGRRLVMEAGLNLKHDHRQGFCFTTNQTVPSCRAIMKDNAKNG